MTTSRRSKVVVYWREQVNKARLSLSLAQKDYTDIITANTRFYVNFGSYPEKGKEIENQRYIDLVKAIIHVVRTENKYFNVLGNEGRVSGGN